MHVVNERNLLPTATTDSPQASALQALRNVFQPCLFTMTTTAAGFLALLTSPMAILRNFGLFAALGIALCLGLTFLLGVVLLPLTRPQPRAIRATGGPACCASTNGCCGTAGPAQRVSVALTLGLLAGTLPPAQRYLHPGLPTRRLRGGDRPPRHGSRLGPLHAAGAAGAAPPRPHRSIAAGW